MEPYHQGKDIEFSTVPLTGARLNLFKSEIYETYSPYGASATLADMVNMKDTQLGLAANRKWRGERFPTEQIVYSVGRGRKQFVPLQVSA